MILKSDLKLCEENQKNNGEISTEVGIIINLLPDFIKLVLSILKNYDLSQYDVPSTLTVSPFGEDESITLKLLNKEVQQ